MSLEIVGPWDELIQRPDLHGRKVKVTILDESESPVPAGDAWLAALDRMTTNAVHTGHDVDTSRESIYSGTIDDTR